MPSQPCPQETNSYAEQAAGSRNVILRSLFTKIFQRGQRPFTGLYFIKNKEALSRNYFFTACRFQITDQTLRRYILTKKRSHRQIGFQIDIDNVAELLFPKLAQDVGFSNLPRAVQKKRLTFSVRPLFPIQKQRFDFSFHELRPFFLFSPRAHES